MPSLIDPLSAPPNSLFLAEVLAALTKRRKAIRYKLRQVTVEKVLERSDHDECEKLEITCNGYFGRRTRLFLWEDRWAFVDARKLTRNACEWEFTSQGRLSGGIEGRQLVATLEQTIAANELDAAQALESIWAPLLAKGPRAVP